MAAAGAGPVGVRLGLAAALGLGVAVAVLWVTGQRTGVNYLVPGGAGGGGQGGRADLLDRALPQRSG